MRRYKNKLFAILLSVLAVISFTSCEDYEWRKGSMNYRATVNAAPNGVIQNDMTINYNYVLVGGNYSSINDIRYNSGKIEINTNNYLGVLKLKIANSNVLLKLDTLRDGGRYEYEGNEVDDFLYDIVETIRRDGYATIYVEGYADRYAQFDLNFYINIEAYVSL